MTLVYVLEELREGQRVDQPPRSRERVERRAADDIGAQASRDALALRRRGHRRPAAIARQGADQAFALEAAEVAIQRPAHGAVAVRLERVALAGGQRAGLGEQEQPLLQADRVDRGARNLRD